MCHERKRCQERMALPLVSLEFTSRCGLPLGAAIRRRGVKSRVAKGDGSRTALAQRGECGLRA
jgi:hypothetical protein